MGKWPGAFLHFRVLCEFIRYDLVFRARGFAGIRQGMASGQEDRRIEGGIESSTICRAVAFVSSFYWKPLLCLQRSVVTARLLRGYGIRAQVVVGFRANPFLSHAWVEVGGRVVNDSPAYQTRLEILDRF